MGDSLMQFNDYSTYPQTGWVQVLDRFMNDPKKVRVCDYALNGRSTKSFIDEGQYQKALDDVEKGDVNIDIERFQPVEELFADVQSD